MKRLFYILTISVLALNCQKPLNSENPVIAGRTLATLTTSGVTSITNASAGSGGNISSDGGSAITARGICWSTSPNPVITGNRTTDGSGVGIFSSNLTGLSPLTVYYVRAYSTNGEGTAYGNELSFTTTGYTAALATLTTSNVSQSTSTTAVSGGNISNDGGALITARGVCWSTVTNPLVSGSHTTDGTGLGTFSSTITGLSTGVQYYVRAYATNSQGTAYGNEINFVNSATAQVYVAGVDGTAKLWKNDTVNFSGSGSSSVFYCVFVSGNDVYLTGSDNTGGKYWKNGVETSLTSGGSPSNGPGLSVFASGTDVYVAGLEYANARVAKSWKNGIGTSLSNTWNQGYSEANSVFVSGADVYIVGLEYNPSSIAVAKLWKNGVGTNLTDGTQRNSATGVFVAGNDVYVCGFEYDNSFNIRAKFWKNGVATNLPSASNVASASSIFVSGNDVYIAGYEENPNTFMRTARFWKNGVGTNLTDGSKIAQALSISVFNSDVYVAGYERAPNVPNMGSLDIAKLWKNGVVTNLSLPGVGSRANAVFVK